VSGLVLRGSGSSRIGFLRRVVEPYGNAQPRVVATAKGCDLVMTLFRRPDMSDARLASATERALRGLKAAKRMLEKVD
jgi:hypothetical protein